MADRHRCSRPSKQSKSSSKIAADVHDRDSDSSSSTSEQSGDGSNSNSNSLNAFANDGSFLARFKQMQEACQQQAQATQAEDAQFAVPTSVSAVKTEQAADENNSGPKKRALPFVGKRRGGKVLKTGVVHKPKVDDEEELPKDAWSRYLAEVRKYRERSCDDEEKTRPLVK